MWWAPAGTCGLHSVDQCMLGWAENMPVAESGTLIIMTTPSSIDPSHQRVYLHGTHVPIIDWARHVL